MKKLIIAAAIVCAAIVSQAAQINWRSGGIKDFVGAAYTGDATLILTDTTAGATQEFGGSFVSGTIQALIGDASAPDAGFIVQGHVYSGYFTMTDADGNIYTSATRSGVQATSPSVANFMVGAGSWTPAPIPEPTSGLLLLLGVAGLALKRRRA